MKTSKTLFIAMILVLNIFIIYQAGFAMSYMINLDQKSPNEKIGSNTTIIKAIDDAKKITIGSNQTFGKELIEKLDKNRTTAIININGTPAANIPDVTDPVGYAIGYASTGLAGSNVEIMEDGYTYNFTESTTNPRVFSEDFATNRTIQFKGEVEALEHDQIAVIIAITMDADAITKILKAGNVPLNSVIIVQATTIDSQQAFQALFDQYHEGFSLRDAGTNNHRVVIKALQGAV